MTLADIIKNKIHSEVKPENTVRAAIYARVSTNNLGQKESCANQVSYALSYVNQYPNITVEGIYVDDGLSGKNDDNRPKYQEMLKAVKGGKIDVVIIKDFSRSNRSTKSFELEEFLLDHDATFINLANGNIEDLEDPDEALMRGFQYLMDAKVVRDQSKKGHIVQETRIANKILNNKDVVLGYRWNKELKIITIDEDTSEIVREIFDKYTYKKMSFQKIADSFEGSKYSFSENTIKRIITDERYIGHFYINKSTTILGTGNKKSKRKKLPKEDWVLVERLDLQIVDTEVFAIAQLRYQEKGTKYHYLGDYQKKEKFHSLTTFGGLIKCACCGKIYRTGFADRKQTIRIYRIAKPLSCKNSIPHILTEDMENITKTALRLLFDKSNGILSSIEQVLRECVEESQDTGDNKIRLLKQKKAKMEKELNNTLSFIKEGGLTAESMSLFKKDINDFTANIKNLDSEIKELESQCLDNSFIDRKMSEITKSMNALSKFEEIDEEQVHHYVRLIITDNDGFIHLILKSDTIQDEDSFDWSKDNGFDNVIESSLFLLSFTYDLSILKQGKTTKKTITVKIYLK